MPVTANLMDYAGQTLHMYKEVKRGVVEGWVQERLTCHRDRSEQRRCDMCHELLTQHALLLQKGHAESAFRDACHACTSSGEVVTVPQVGPPYQVLFFQTNLLHIHWIPSPQL